MTLSTTSPGDEREAFEAWYVADAIRQGFPTMTVEEVKNLRDDDHYGAHRAMLNGKWEGWQARASSSTVQQVGAEPLTAEQVVAQTMNYSMHEASIFFAGVIFAEEHHGIISPKSEQGDQQ